MRISWISALAVAMVCNWQAVAQTSAGVKGVVTDSSGALVTGAMIVVTNLDNGARRETPTNDGGAYQFALLQPGRYSIAARKQGFKQMTRDGVELELNQIAADRLHDGGWRGERNRRSTGFGAAARIEYFVGRTGD